jgi:hypothetical protein
LINRTQFWLCNWEPKQKNHRSHDQTDHHCNSRIGIHWLDCVRSDEIQSPAIGLANPDANTGAVNPSAKGNNRSKDYCNANAAESDADGACRRSGEANAGTKN